jgi:hypothetical protein
MKRRCYLISGLLSLIIFIGCRASSTTSSSSTPQTNETVSFSEAVSKVDLQNLNETLKTPRGAGLAFFAAIKSNKAVLRQIVSPYIQKHRDQLEAEGTSDWKRWIEMWSKQAESIQSIGEAQPSEYDSFIKREVTVVPVTILKNGETKQVNIRLAKYDDLWRWNEN